ncbi:MAG: ribonuclease Z [Candidatus Rehaiarchaeum fermentans]|nr:ribonuclease Z [Candidatus Rehaiarchaeum fermentans]MCW1302522.1 ribonuclease Z [Candidatus Rehaiarchaeum fermentans]
MESILLGTSSAFPTEERNHPSLYLNLNGKKILIDCGEGTQRQIRIAKLSPEIDYIFITHWHADHSLGIVGIISSAKMLKLNLPHIFGPKGTKKKIEELLNVFGIDAKISVTEINAPKEKKILDIDNFEVFAINLKHTIPCLGYKIKEKDRIKINKEFLIKNGIKEGPYLKNLTLGKDIEYKGKIIKAKDATFKLKGKIIAYITDTKKIKSIEKFVKDADLLFIESTFMSELKKEANLYYHLSIEDSLKIAKLARVKKTVLIHISQRYKNEDVIKEIERFKNGLNVELGKDYNIYKL